MTGPVLQGLTGLFSPPVLALFDRIQSVYINELLNRNQSHPMSGLPNWLQQVWEQWPVDSFSKSGWWFQHVSTPETIRVIGISSQILLNRRNGGKRQAELGRLFSVLISSLSTNSHQFDRDISPLFSCFNPDIPAYFWINDDNSQPYPSSANIIMGNI